MTLQLRLEFDRLQAHKEFLAVAQQFYNGATSALRRRDYQNRRLHDGFTAECVIKQQLQQNQPNYFIAKSSTIACPYKRKSLPQWPTYMVKLHCQKPMAEAHRGGGLINQA